LPKLFRVGPVVVAISILLVLPLIPAVSSEEGQLRLGVSSYLSEPILGYLSGGTFHRLLAERDPQRAFSDSPLASAAPSSYGPSGPLVTIPYRSPTAKFSRNLIVTFDLGAIPYQNEPSIAYNPQNPDHLIMVSHDYDVSCVTGYVSFDAGETWRGPFHTQPFVDDSFCSDPVVAFGRDGTAYFAYLSIGTRPLRIANYPFEATVSSAVVAVSTDGGLSWNFPNIAALGGNPVPAIDRVSLPFVDKTWMAVGPNPQDLSRDNVYVSYTEFKTVFPYRVEGFFLFLFEPIIEVSIRLVRSTDGGRTWSQPVTVSPVYSYLLSDVDRPLVQGSNIAVANDGTVYVAYYDSLPDGPFKGLFTPYVAVSKDGGLTFSKPFPVVPGGMFEQDFFLKPTVFRSWSSMFPFIAVSPSDSNTVYVAFGALGQAAGDNSDVFFSKSTDGGRTWSRPKRVNDDITTRNQFFPAITVSPNGTIHMIWGDMRDDPDNYRYHIYYTKSSDGGETFLENSRVTDYASNPGFGIPVFVGDYWGLAATDDRVYAAWTDSRAGFRGIRNQDIAFAKLGSIPSPSILLSPPEGPAGQTVTITGFNFAARQREVFIEVDGVVISSFLTDNAGRFQAQIFMPVSGEGAHLVRAIDVLGNVAEANYYASFGFNTVRDQVDKTASELKAKLSELEQKVGVGERQAINQTELVRLILSRLEPALSRSPQQVADSISVALAAAALVLSSVAVTAVLVLARRRR